jgi:hypothetical protein
VHAFDLAYEMMVGLVSFGYQKMGLTDETRPVRDLGDARLSIELLRAIRDVVEREEGAARVRELQDTLAQMQLSYAHAVQLQGAEHAADEPAAAAPANVTPPDETADDEPGGAGGEAATPPTESAEQTAAKPAAKKKPARKPAAKKTAAKKKPEKKPPAEKPNEG